MKIMGAMIKLMIPTSSSLIRGRTRYGNGSRETPTMETGRRAESKQQHLRLQTKELGDRWGIKRDDGGKVRGGDREVRALVELLVCAAV
jgi:hypothetical protein